MVCEDGVMNRVTLICADVLAGLGMLASVEVILVAEGRGGTKKGYPF